MHKKAFLDEIPQSGPYSLVLFICNSTEASKWKQMQRSMTVFAECIGSRSQEALKIFEEEENCTIYKFSLATANVLDSGYILHPIYQSSS